MISRNFASPDAILKISNGLGQDTKLLNDFKVLMPSADEKSVEILWDLFVARISTLHGTELASKYMEELASSKRKSNATGCSVSVSATMEQLRAVKKRKRMVIKNVVDLTQVVSQVDVDLDVGQKVTAIEGTGSGTRQYEGTVVEIDPYSEVIIICCEVSGYPHGYNMAVPFSSRKSRIKDPGSSSLNGSKRKRIRKVIQSM